MPSSKYSIQPLYGFAVAQLDGDLHLAVAERTQVERFLAGLARRRCLGATAGRQWRSHICILDANRAQRVADAKPT